MIQYSIHFKWSPCSALVIICYHREILHNYWLYCLHCPFCTFQTHQYFATGNLYLLISLTYFFPLLPHSPLATIWLFCISVFLCLFNLLWFLDSTYKWNYTVFVFVWFISLSMRLSPSMMSQMARFHSFIWLVFHCMYIAPLHLHPLMNT